MSSNISQNDALRLPPRLLHPDLWTPLEESRWKELLQEKARRRRDEAFRYFAPNPAQKRFIDEIAREGRFIVINGGGNGEGKTYVLIAILAAICWPKMAPPCFAYPFFMKFPHPQKLWIVSNPSELGMTGAIQSTIETLWPRDRYVSHKNGRQFPSVFKTDTGFDIELKSTEQDRTEFRGANVGLIAINEPLPEDIFHECIARTRKGGAIIGAMTSLDDEPWVVDGLLEKHDGKDFRIVYGNVEENCKDHTPGGTLEHTQIERILSKYPDDEQEARRTGKPLSLSGRIFKPFDRAVHVLKSEVRPSGNFQILNVMDPHGGKPIAMIWAFADSGGNVTVFDEWPNTPFFGARDPGLGPTDYRDIILTKEAGLTIERRIIDRHYGNTSHKPGSLTIKQDFAALGLDYEDSYTAGESVPEVQTGIMAVIDAMRYDKSKPISSTNHPRLQISPNCRNAIESLAKWTRDPKTMKPKDNHFKDFCDCVRYLVKAEPKWEPPVSWNPSAGPTWGVRT